MDHSGDVSNYGDLACDHQAECIRLTGRSDVFHAHIIMCGKDGLDIVAPKYTNPGTYLIVRMRNFSPAAPPGYEEHIRSAGLAEVRRVDEIIDENGFIYKMRLKYI